MQSKKIGRGLCQRMFAARVFVREYVCVCVNTRARSCDRKRPRLAAHHRTVSWNRLHQSVYPPRRRKVCRTQRAEFCRNQSTSMIF